MCKRFLVVASKGAGITVVESLLFKELSDFDMVSDEHPGIFFPFLVTSSPKYTDKWAQYILQNS